MLKATTHITLSILVLMLTIGITINKHYSNGEFYSLSVVGEADACMSLESEVCTMVNMSDECGMHNHELEDNKQTSCSCEDTEEYVYFDEDYTISRKIELSNVYEKQIAIFASSLLFNYSIIVNKQILNTDISSSVLKIHDFASFFQVFRC